MNEGSKIITKDGKISMPAKLILFAPTIALLFVHYRYALIYVILANVAIVGAEWMIRKRRRKLAEETGTI